MPCTQVFLLRTPSITGVDKAKLQQQVLATIFSNGKRGRVLVSEFGGGRGGQATPCAATAGAATAAEGGDQCPGAQ